jgi:secreted trypsin-like serine protease
MKKIVLALGIFLLSQTSFAADQSTENSALYVAVPQIMGGYEAPAGAWPWMTALLDANNSNNYQAQYCGGVLIAANWVLTAGHCVEGLSAGDIDVAVGVHDLATWSGTRIAVKRIVLHPNYVDYNANDKNSLANDLALLELNSTSGQTPITIYSGASVQGFDSRLLGQTTTLAGWGLADTATTWYYPSKLQQVNLPVVTDSYCNNPYGVTLTDSQVCAGYSVAKDACRGDSGGPMMFQVDGQWAHVGLVSYGADCEEYGGKYGVYTRTSAYVDFIKQYVPKAKFTAGATPSPTTTPQSLPWLMLLLHQEVR